MPVEDDLTGIPKRGDLIAGKFEVERVLGVGGMGVVVAARHVHLGQKVAVKFLRPEAAKHKEAVGRFLREARSTVGLQSAHVVRVTDVGTLETGLPYMVMEHLAGEDLSDLLKARRALSVEETCDFVLQACEALAEAHFAGIVHRDLKPSNLFLTRKPDGSALVKVLDFGISKAVDPEGIEQNLTATSSVMGSPLYMSPEQLRSSKKVDARTDLWALGVILFELTTGFTPFEDETMTGLCAKIVADAPTALRDKRPDLPFAFESVVMKCLEKDVSRRFQSVGELALALREFASTEGKGSADRASRIGGPRASMSSGAAIAVSPSHSQLPVAHESGAGASGRTGYADTVGAWQSGHEKKRRATVVAAIAVACAIGAIGAGALVFKREPTSAATAPRVDTTSAVVKTPPAATSVAPAPSLDPPAGATASTPAVAIAVPSSSTKPNAPAPARPIGSAVAPQPPHPPKPPVTPPAQGGDLLLDRK